MEINEPRTKRYTKYSFKCDASPAFRYMLFYFNNFPNFISFINFGCRISYSMNHLQKIFTVFEWDTLLSLFGFLFCMLNRAEIFLVCCPITSFCPSFKIYKHFSYLMGILISILCKMKLISRESQKTFTVNWCLNSILIDISKLITYFQKQFSVKTGKTFIDFILHCVFYLFELSSKLQPLKRLCSLLKNFNGVCTLIQGICKSQSLVLFGQYTVYGNGACFLCEKYYTCEDSWACIWFYLRYFRTATKETIFQKP